MKKDRFRLDKIISLVVGITIALITSVVTGLLISIKPCSMERFCLPALGILIFYSISICFILYVFDKLREQKQNGTKKNT